MKQLKSKNLPIILLFMVMVFSLSTKVCAQYLIVNSGSFFVKDSTNLSLEGVSIINNDLFETEQKTVVHLSGNDTISFSGGSDIEINNLSVSNYLALNTNLSIINNLHMNGGNINLLNNNIYLLGQIIGESNNSRILSTGFGEIITNTISPASSNGNIGLSVNYEDGRLVEISRGHMISSTESYNSISRYFTIDPADENVNLTFNYLVAELGELDENMLTPWYEINNSWYPVTEFTLNTAAKQVTTTIYTSFDKITLFASEFDDVNIASGFSPNNDGINDFFTIEGVERYPNNKLVVFNKWGEIVYEASPYLNDWSGESDNRLTNSNDRKLLDGTYYYFFFKEKSNKNSVSKGYVELKNNTD